MFITGIKTNAGAQWLMALFGYAAVMYFMTNGARRIEIQYFGKNAEYMEYMNKTPVLIPFIPIYHLVKSERIKKTEGV